MYNWIRPFNSRLFRGMRMHTPVHLHLGTIAIPAHCTKIPVQNDTILLALVSQVTPVPPPPRRKQNEWNMIKFLQEIVNNGEIKKCPRMSGSYPPYTAGTVTVPHSPSVGNIGQESKILSMCPLGVGFIDAKEFSM